MTNDTNKINNTSPRPWIQTGRYEFETVCRSTLCPKEWLQLEKIYVCEWCLKTTIHATAARRHRVRRTYPFLPRSNDTDRIIGRSNTVIYCENMHPYYFAQKRHRIRSRIFTVYGPILVRIVRPGYLHLNLLLLLLKNS